MTGKLDILQGDEAYAFDPKAARFLADGFGEYAIRMKVGQTGTRRGFEDDEFSYGSVNETGMMGRRLRRLIFNGDGDVFATLSSDLPGTFEGWRCELIWEWPGARFRYVLPPTSKDGDFRLDAGVGNDLADAYAAIAPKVGDWIGVRLRFAYVERMSWALSQEAFDQL